MNPLPKGQKINLVAMGIVYFVMFLIALGINAKWKLFQYPKYDQTFWVTVFLDCVIGVGLGLLVTLFTTLMVRHIRSFAALAKEFYRFIGPLGHKEIFFISAFSAIGEEFFFRGFCQGAFGLIVASLAFGLLHIGPSRRFIPWTIFAVVVGFALGGAYAWRGNLLTPVAMHFTINHVNLLALRKIGREMES
jgi:membrane protease YdiL (CAAX protease family)